MAQEEINEKNQDVIDFSNTDFDMNAFSMDAVEVEEEESSSEENDETQVSDESKTQESVANEEPSEDVEEPTDEEDEDNSGEGEDGDSSSGKLYSSLASALQEQGILSSLDPDEKIESVEDLMDKFNAELSKRELADLTDTQKEYLRGLREGIPEEDVKEYILSSNDLNSITNDEIEQNAELRIELIKQDFIESGVKPEKAAKLAKLSADSGDDTQDALEALGNLKEGISKKYQDQLKAKEQAKLEQQKKQEEDLAKLKKEVDTVKEIIPGLKLTNTEKEKLYEQMTKPAGTYNGQPISAIQKKRMENPMDFELKLNYLFKVTNGFENFDKIVKKTKSSSIKELEKQLQGNSFSPGSSGRTGENFTKSSDFKGLAEGKII